MRSTRLLLPLVLSAALAGCTGAGGSETPAPSITSAPPALSPSTTVSAPPQPTPSASSSESEETVVGTVVRFTGEGAVVEVTIGEDNPTVRDFLSLLPTTVAVEEYAGAEKIAYLQRELETAGSPGSDPEDGDLIYYAPWGNLGFYYDGSGIGYSDQTIHLGHYDADADELAALEGDDVAIDIAPR